MSSRDDKAQRYITSLDAARCDGSWNDLPELIRKVTKHAPQKKCLIQTATAENDVARAVSLRSAGPSSITERIPQLISVIEKEKGSTEEEFQAQTCLGWIHWVLEEPQLAIGKLPPDLAEVVHQFAAAKQSVSTWTEICLLKAVYIRGTGLVRAGNTTDALQTFQSIGTWMIESREKAVAQSQLAYWSEQILAQAALIYVKGTDFRHPDLSQVSQGLQAFRDWARFATRSKEVLPETYGNSSAHLSRMSVCRADYQFLSDMLRYGIKYPTKDADSTKSDQAAELRQVEIMCENELMRVTPFPNAVGSNAVVEEWVEQVVQNWQALCGKQIFAGSLEEGSRNAVGRHVLDILYRAAMKTFHSTLILRRLFQVHKSLAEFDLAYRALDTYIELIERGRARAAKFDEATTGQDDDETVFITLSEGIESLCSFGRQDEAEKAYQLSQKLEKWVEQLLPGSDESATVNGHTEGNVEGLSTQKSAISPRTLETVYRAIGIGRAQWARWTPFTENRSSLQAKAVSSFKKTAAQNTGNKMHLKTIYALAVLLAEMRDINQAIEYVKKALIWEDSASDGDLNFAVERNLIPFWHLLALLLTARQDFETAGQTCSAAFEQFTSSSVLFGTKKQPLLSSKPSTEKASLAEEHQRGLVDDMECAQLQQIIEIRITELALTEIFEGPEEAVNRSNELLGLFSRLFGHLGIGTEEKANPKALEPPKSSATTIRSFRGGVFGRKKMDSSGESNDKAERLGDTPSTRPTTQATNAPTIQVTDEHGKSPTNKHHLFRKSEDHASRQSKHSIKSHKREGSITKFIRPRSKESKLEQEKGNVLNQKQSFETSASQPTKNGTTDESLLPHDVEKNHLATQHTTDRVPVPSTSLTSKSSPQAREDLSSDDHNSDPNENFQPTSSVGINDRPASGQITSSANSSVPPPQFSKPASQKHALALLVKIWLVIATLYRRAHLFDDALEACDEAAKAAQRIEAMTAGVESSARSFAEPGWGGTVKSSDEVWADVFCERAEMALGRASAGAGKGPVEIIDSERVREAVEHFEQCLMFFPNHAKGIVGLSNVLLDFYEKRVELGKRVDDGKPKDDDREKTKRSAVKVSNTMQNGTVTPAVTAERPVSGSGQRSASAASNSSNTDDELRKTPENLNRLAARDRAYGLLSTLTKLGTGWDDSEAWFALARAHELGGEMEKAKEILWWCVDLEDKRPIRSWRNLGCSGYVL